MYFTTVHRPFNLYHFVFMLALLFNVEANAQDINPPNAPWGPKDTIIVSIINYAGEIMPYRELDVVYVSSLPPDKLAKVIEKYNRLRNAVYVTYPYARTAGITLNDVAAHLKKVPSKTERKKYIKSREKELKQKFSDPLTNLSVYQGKVLMKLINRQTGNDCYEIIKEYKGGLNARMYQTVAFFFSSNLKQDYHTTDASDRQIEAIVKEIDGMWYNNPYKPGLKLP